MKQLAIHFNDLLALVVVVGVPLVAAFGKLAESYVATMFAGWLVVIYFYFRKAPPDVGGAP